MSNDLFSVVIIQSNAKKHLINCYQIYKFVIEKSQAIYIFLISHTRSKTRNQNLVISKKLFQVQDWGAVTGQGLLYYIKSMPTTVLSNVCTFIGLVNEARYISISIVSDKNGLFNLQQVDNQANNSRNLLSTRCNYNFVQPSSKSCITTLVHFFPNLVFLGLITLLF